MKFKVANNLKYTPENILRTCGFFLIFDQKTQKSSFIRKITSNRYPRFHLYLKEINDELIFDLHLDQNKTVYSGQKAHNADYDTPEVKQELVRIFQKVKKTIPKPKEEKPLSQTTPLSNENHPNWLSKLFKKN